MVIPKNLKPRSFDLDYYQKRNKGPTISNPMILFIIRKDHLENGQLKHFQTGISLLVKEL